ncbi:MAG: hypothetical protein U9Q04_03580 [Campylobacterota bacterium]|nr:hypothetical protein [Campylobacterota bacterium]
MNKKNIKEVEIMEKEYDFSNGERGKFYNKDANFHIPVYLEPEVESFFTKLAKKQNTNLGEMVNSLLFKDKELIELANTKV